MHECLNPVIKADHSAQYVDGIGIAANSPEPLLTNLRAKLKSIQNAVLKLSFAKCSTGTTKIGFRGRTITPNGVTRQTQMITKVLEKVKIPRSKKALQRHIGFQNYY